MGLIETPETAADLLSEAPRHRRLYDYWREKAAGRAAPGRADVDPLDLPELLANLWLMDVLEHPTDFRIRLAGTAIRTIVGRDITGLMFDEVFTGAEGAAVREEYAAVLSSWRPHFAEHTVDWAGREHVTYRRLVVPLSSDGERIDMLLGLAEEAPVR